MRKHEIICALAIVMVSAGFAFTQDDAQSLGDLARQQRQKHEQAQAVQTKDGKSAKVFTNADLPAAPNDSAVEPADSGKAPPPAASGKLLAGSEQMKAAIQEQKAQITELQQQIDQLNGSIRYAPGNCVRGCVQWNERQDKKQGEVERMQAQLQEMKSRLEEMQESARKQGFGSSVYDP